MGFDEAVLKCLSKYTVFTGRARPSEFWWFMLLYLSALGLTFGALALSIGLAKAGLLLIAALTAPALAVMVRRMHDIGAAGWMLIFLVPIIGQILMLAWLTRPSIRRLNRFGPEPGKTGDRYLLFAR
ncbi:MAG: DUF805 domain-containing protein [Proteobacteria bacterium]|nr:DUF805 domain-containing protein [Pseudomonadota bacterium]MCH8952228.1 DUF805 domain-containing protein [Pseudomonadota bacterium]